MNFKEIEDKIIEIFSYLYETVNYELYEIVDLEDNNNYDC